MNGPGVTRKQGSLHLLSALILVAATLSPLVTPAYAIAGSPTDGLSADLNRALPAWWGAVSSPAARSATAESYRALRAWWPRGGAVAAQRVRPLTTATAHHFLVTVPATATAGDPFPTTIEARDSANNRAYITTTVSLITTNGGQINPTAATLVSGTWSGQVSLTATGIGRTVRAISGTITGQATITIYAAALTNLTVTPNPATVLVGQTRTFIASGTDQYGNPVSVSPNWSTNGGSINPGPSVSSAFTAQTTPATGKLVTATQGTIKGTAVVNIPHGPVQTFHISPIPIATQTAGDDFLLDVEAWDEYGNLATSYNGTATLDDTTGTIAPGSLSFSGGIWGGVVSITQAAEAVVITIADGPATGQSNSFTVLPAELDHLDMTGYPASTVAGDPFQAPVVVTAYDRFGNIKTDYTGQVRFSSSDISATLPAAYIFTSGDAGVHPFAGSAFKLFRTPSQTISVEDQAQGIGESSGPITVIPAALGSFELVGYPSSTTAGEPFPSAIIVRAFDVFRNLKTNYVGTVHFSSSDTLFDAPTDHIFRTVDAGVHSFPGSQFTLYHTPRQTISVEDQAAGVQETSASIDVAPGDLHHFTVDPFGTEQVAGTPFNLTIRAFDAWDNAKTDYTGRPTLNDSTGTLVPTRTNCAWNSGVCVQSVTITRARTADNIIITDGSVQAIAGPFNVGPAAPDHIRVNSKPNNGGAAYGYGVEVITHVMDIYQTYTAWAGCYDRYDNFCGDIDANWTATGVLGNGTLVPSTGISTTFTPAPILSGTGRIRATSVDYGFFDRTGQFEIKAPWLLISKARTWPPTEVVPAGTQNLEYTIVFTNVGNVAARDVRITEFYDSNVSYAVSVPRPDDGTNNVWSRPIFGLDGTQESRTIRVFVDVGASLPPDTILTNVVEISGPRTQSASSLVTAIVTSTPALLVSLSDLDNDPVIAGDVFILLVSYTNDGTAPVTNLVLTLTLDSHLTFETAGVTPVIPPTAATGNTGRWELGTLAGGRQRSFWLRARIDDFMPDQYSLVNQAVIHSDETGSAYGIEPTLVNAPVLALRKTTPFSLVPAFDRLVYTLVYSNVGNSVASALVITDALPVNTDFASCQPLPCSHSDGIVTWERSEGLAIGARRAVTLVVDVRRNLDTGTLLTNYARVRVFDTPRYSADAQIETTVVSSPSLWLVISDGTTSVEAGDNLVYTLSYLNNGSGKAYNTTIVATPPSSQHIEDVRCSPTAVCEWLDGQIIYDIGTLLGGEGGSVQMLARVRDPLPAGSRVITASAVISTITSGDAPEGNRAQDVDDIATRPDLIVTADYQNIMPYPGKRVTYTIHYSNEGHIATTGVVITLTQPPNTTYQEDVSDDEWVSQGDRRYRYAAGDLDYNEGGNLRFVVTLTTTHFTNVMTNFDAILEINDDGGSGSDNKPNSNVFKARLGVPNLLIESTTTDSSIWKGQPGSLTVTVRNAGTGPSYGIYLPGGIYALDLFVNPATPPKSFPIEKFGECFIFLNPIPPGIAATAVISFTDLGPEFWQNRSGFCGATELSQLWLKVDNWDPGSNPQPDAFGMIPESNEFDNIFNPLPSTQVFLPVILRRY